MTNNHIIGPNIGLTVPLENRTTILTEKDVGEMKAVHEICKEYGISRKTLYYYDQIGILKPTSRYGKQKAKFYSKKACKRLEAILLYQKAGLTLNSIQKILDDAEANPISILNDSITAMQKQKADLDEKIAFAKQLISQLEEK